MKTKKGLAAELKKCLKNIAKERDRIDELLGLYVDVLDSESEARQYIEAAVEKLSEDV